MSLRILFSACAILLPITLVIAGFSDHTVNSNSNHQIDKKPVLIIEPQLDNTDEDSLMYSEGFENGLGDWSSDDCTDAGIKWHISNFNGYSSTNSWWCGDSALGGYDNHWLQYLVTPVLDFSAVADPILTFKLYYAIEGTGGTPPLYDGWDGCNVWASMDNGATWEVINPTIPAYNCESLYSFGEDWGMGPGIPGWAGSSGGWVDAEFDLSPIAGAEQVQIRFAFCSDPAICTINDSTCIGFFVDEVSIDDGAANLLYNDADGIAYPEEFTLDTGPVAGDYWQLTDVTSASGDWSAWCDHAYHYNLSDALVTPWIYIPEGYVKVYFTFWLWCDLPDFDGDNNGYLEDYYQVEVSTDGVIWESLFYDYGGEGRPGAWNVGWEEYEPSLYNPMELTEYAGQSVKLRWRVITDGDDNGGVGTGMYIDDFSVWCSNACDHDAGADNLYIPFPTSMSMPEVECSVELHNYGQENQSNVPAFARIDSTNSIPLIPWANIFAGDYVIKEFTWDLSGFSVGPHWVDAYTTLLWDQNRSNDTTTAGYVEVTPPGVYELGYDARGYSWHPVYYFNFDPGEGAMCRFSPAEHNIIDNIDITEARILFYNEGEANVHVYDAGTPTSPGAELSIIPIDVSPAQTYPNWKEISLSGIPGMANRDEPFWIWVEILDFDSATIMGDDLHFGDEHYFRYDGVTAVIYPYEFYIRAVAVTSPSLPICIELTPHNPPIQIPANGDSFDFDITVGNNGIFPAIVDIWTFATLPDGSQYGPLINAGSITLPPGSIASRDRTQFVPANAPAGDYTYDAYIGDYPNIILDEDHFDFEKLSVSDGGAVVYEWDNWGEHLCDISGEKLLKTSNSFILYSAYPNPFNSETHISFNLPQAGIISLMVYDLQGREIARLYDGFHTAGIFGANFDASNLPSGVYFARLTAGGFHHTRKLLLLK